MLVSLFMTCLVIRVAMAMVLPLLRNPHSCLCHSSVASLLLPSTAFSTRTPSGLTLPLHRRWVSALTALSGGTAATALEKTAESSEASRTRLIAQNIPWNSTSDDIKALFAKHGAVLDIEVRISLFFICLRKIETLNTNPFFDLVSFFFWVPLAVSFMDVNQWIFSHLRYLWKGKKNTSLYIQA